MSPTPDSLSRFSSTCWSLVMNHDPTLPKSSEALGELCRRYWYPVYAYVRKGGCTPDEAQHITRSFFAELLQHPLRSDSPSRPRFRDFLLERLSAFVAGDWGNLAAAEATLQAPTIDHLESQLLSANTAATPDEVFQHAFAAEVIERALDSLREEARYSGHLEMFELMRPFLAIDPSPGEYNTLARELGHRQLAMIVALKRLRQRFRELVARELSDTVDSPADLLEEQRTLHGFLHPRS